MKEECSFTCQHLKCVSMSVGKSFDFCAFFIAGLYTNQLSEAHETIPIKVKENGDVSHDLNHHHSNTEEFVRFNLSIFDEQHHLILTPSVEFLAPSFVVEWRSKEKHVRRKPKETSKICHYQGFVHGDPQSRVAISACNGLVRAFIILS